MLVLTDSEILCTHLMKVFFQLGCGWYGNSAFLDPVISNMFERSSILQAMYMKQWYGARIVRMGYNVMLIDSGTSAVKYLVSLIF